MDRQVTALLDTGSETSIAPLGVFRDARADGVDLDAYVRRIPRVKATVRDAPNVVMDFIDTIRMPVTLQGKAGSVAFHVGHGLEEVVILGTNALELFGIKLAFPEKGEANVVGQEQRTQAVVKDRVFVLPVGTKVVELAGEVAKGEHCLWSTHPAIGHGICRVDDESKTVATICNFLEQPVVPRKGEVVGERDECRWSPVTAHELGADSWSVLMTTKEMTKKRDWRSCRKF